MAVVDALTVCFMVICAILSLVFAAFKLPIIAALSIIGMYYFAIYHIAQFVGESRGWYAGVLPTYFIVLIITILSFALIYYRYGLVQNGNHVDISFFESVYFSVTTWTTLGYGDFAPSPKIRLITSLEAILGYIGLGLWISLITNFIKNLADNRQEVIEHNDKLMAKIIKNVPEENLNQNEKQE